MDERDTHYGKKQVCNHKFIILAFVNLIPQPLLLPEKGNIKHL
jgi:hypothetical protein